jgi:type VI secretion system protein ImpH
MMKPRTLENLPSLKPLLERSNAYSFFQALREVEASRPDLPRIGFAASPKREAHRIRQPADASFAPNTIDRVSIEDEIIGIEQRFFGLLGPSGPFPTHWTELVRNRSRHANDETLQSFLDVFHHRMASLFYRAWSSARPAIQRDRPEEDRFATYLRSIAGIGLENGKHRDDLSDESKQFFAGHLGTAQKHAEGLQSILQSMFSVPVSIEPFSLRWLRLDDRDCTRIGSVGPGRKGNANCLGQSTVLGHRVPDRQSQFHVRLGPMDAPTYQCFLPGTTQRKILNAVVRNYAGMSIDARVQPILSKEQVPKCKLGSVGSLGRNAWLLSKPTSIDRSDYSFVDSFRETAKDTVAERSRS